MTNKTPFFLEPSNIDESILEHEVREANIVRSLILSLSGFIINLAIIAYLYKYNPLQNTANEILWKNALLILNKSLAVSNLLFTALSIYFIWHKHKTNFLYKNLVHFVMISFGAWGILGTLIHQLNTSSIIPWIVFTLGLSAFLIKPTQLLVYVLFFYLCFYFVLPVYQTDSNYVIFNRLGGAICLFIGYALNLFLWKNRIISFRQARLIETQKKELEENYLKISEYSKALQESNATKDKFFSILSHDLKGSINSSVALTKILEEENIDEKERKQINLLFQNSLQNIYKLLNNVLLWASSQSGTILVKPSTLNAYELVEESIQLLQSLAEQKKITINNGLSKNLFFNADQSMMDTVFRNLLANAIKYSNEGSNINFSASINNIANSNNKSLRITIADEGIGMDANVYESLFRIDKKASLPGTQNEPGTGLGLVLCKEFVEKHGGTISVSSQVGKGSQFIIDLPVKNNN